MDTAASGWYGGVLPTSCPRTWSDNVRTQYNPLPPLLARPGRRSAGSGRSSGATIELVPDRSVSPRSGHCGSRTSRIDSCYRHRVRDLILGAHRVWLWVPVRKLRCPACEKIRAEGFEYVEAWAWVTRRLSRYIAELRRQLSVAQVARAAPEAGSGSW